MVPGKRILILCTGNSCRSQIAEAYLGSLGSDVEVHSGGTHPADEVHPLAIKVMAEDGLNMDVQYPKSVDLFLDEQFDFVITVCSEAEANCPVFTGKVSQRLHFPFPDPAKATGSEEEVLAEFRSVRNSIKDKFLQFYKSIQ